MINLGPYSGKKCPNVRFQPTVLDRILEGTALLIVLVTWISILIVLLPLSSFSSLFVVINLPLPTNGYSFSSFAIFRYCSPF